MKIRRADKSEVPSHDEMAQAIREARQAKLEYQEAEERHKKAQHMLAELMIARKVKTESAEIDGQEVVATIVRTEREVINEEGLRDALGSAFDKIAVLKVDRDLLKRAITDGAVPVDAVSQNVHVYQSTPYIRFSVRGASS